MGCNMLIRETIAPVDEPVTLSELKAHSRIDGTDEDTYLTSLINASRVTIEQLLGVAGELRTLEIVLDDFPRHSCLPIRLPFSPLVSISSIVYRDSSGDEQTWSSDRYRAITGAGGYVTPVHHYEYPDTDKLPGCVTLTGVFGSASVPENFKHAVKLLAASWYEMRESVGDRQSYRIPHGFGFILDSLRSQNL